MKEEVLRKKLSELKSRNSKLTNLMTKRRNEEYIAILEEELSNLLKKKK
jgi:hypothetical protein